MLCKLQSYLMIGITTILLCCDSTPVSGGIMVSVESTTIQAGSTGSINVRLISDSATDNLWGFGIEIEILSSNGRVLEFLHAGGNPQDDHLSSGDYIFSLTGSSAITAGQSGFVGPNTTYVGLDASDDPFGIVGPFDRLLTKLDFTTLTSLAPLEGDTFTVIVNTANGNTFFLDPALTEVDPLFSTTSGTITITGSAAVPEPSSCGLICLSIAAATFRKWKRNRRSSRIQISEVRTN
jgi:hypothetical protein